MTTVTFDFRMLTSQAFSSFWRDVLDSLTNIHGTPRKKMEGSQLLDLLSHKIRKSHVL